MTRRIINGKAYDTSTATKIGKFKWRDYHGSWIVEDTLWKKKNGEYFEESYVPEQSSIEITPLSLEKAKDYVMNYFNDQYEDLFGICEE